MAKSIHKFSGEAYQLYDVYLSKPSAEMARDQLRKAGYLVRIVTQKPKRGFSARYFIYRRKKQ